ncbi:Mor transcription activator family protein [Avibacterium paragallinarum]|uniref:Bacteriophage transcriptional regulator n=1 Tax=Avibacterium paragallinarum TaxID=728 RepID=A0A377I709_AVIPA|nr:Mor transcription activator family protein [Avibacterium paragallinarum]STO71086.1 bacteriophage transcriptional regulator [Avibacterium paragallinarum]STO72515.1 bacteriophage transcriptional regulator [Avibacterium paragallinarum]STO92042.1 bacteriophage transcriptional regulator [Avibacterium paragallinarum]
MDKDKLDVFERKAPEVLADLAAHVEQELINRYEMPEEQAKQAGVDVAMRISRAWAGEIIYIPRALLLALSERDLKIWREFNGVNHRELARKYGVSMQWVYQIVKRMQKEEIDRRQFDMFK